MGVKTMSTRRDFLTATFGSAAALALSGPTIASAAEAEWRNRRDDMRYRRLGRTNFMVSEIAKDDRKHWHYDKTMNGFKRTN